MLEQSEVIEIQKATHELLEHRQFEEADSLIGTLLENNPNDPVALNFLGVMHNEAHHFYLAYQFARRALQEAPHIPQVWVNFGLAAVHLGRRQEAMNAYLKAIELNNNYVMPCINAASMLIDESKWDDAEKMVELALEIEPGNEGALKNKAHILLARHQWREGWELWEKSLGDKFRKEWTYGDEPRWNGEKGKAVVIYGEQGLGDEICYASVIPDAIRDCKKIIIDCHPRLEKLFKRSFPKADVHGTRKNQEPEWLQDARIDARCAMASLPGIYRNSDESFPGTPYLKADPELVRMFKSYWATLGKPVYGLCLHGGSKLTGAEYRKIEPEQFSPLFNADRVFISLDYKPMYDHKLIRKMEWATQCEDYDVTAALIASLDGVIGVNTAAMHAANGLGVPTHILVSTWHQWRYEGEYVWSKTARLYHQAEGEPWRDVIRRVEL